MISLVYDPAEKRMKTGGVAPVVSYESVPTGTDGSVSLVSVGDIVIEETILSGVVTNYQLNFGLEGETIVDVLTPTVCSYSGGFLTHVGNGLAQVNIVSGQRTLPLFLPFEAEGASISRKLDSYVVDSAWDILADNMLAKMVSSPELNYFSTYTNSTATYIHNPSCWIADVDFGAVSVANNTTGSWQAQRAGTAITERHVLAAGHYPLAYGAQLRFVDAAGDLHTRTVIGSFIAGAGFAIDWQIVVLDSDLPGTITPMKIPGDWMTQNEVPPPFLGGNGAYRVGGVAVRLDQFKQCKAALVGSTLGETYGYYIQQSYGGVSHAPFFSTGYITGDASALSVNLLSSLDPAYFSEPISGDSGSPVMVVIDDEPILLFCFHSPISGPRTWSHNGAVLNSLIVEADRNAIARGNLITETGYTVSVASDPSLP